ncbi:hypothetical protein ALNOE001_12360 [Candidatus Methanobinarius endosymbioticus]|uniref:Uncharacterized protein n=1 Tax=Candidatus Methanobinarius endosymbioticus TaxID=2006182 RepID=A0A366M9W1_9EURY|nr:hypothetical protein ALNOE001_12360 [Candidatus Methanobinarius endosymbioticus]
MNNLRFSSVVRGIEISTLTGNVYLKNCKVSGGKYMLEEDHGYFTTDSAFTIFVNKMISLVNCSVSGYEMPVILQSQDLIIKDLIFFNS